ncbi:UNVERIFIED_CONTAM: hypothetical protein Slati_2434000 [Sesamum latifolium]|uniref:Integrase catalytic domain-containing protein n=1 Tax=Sesamum latifolium TaxID=2727402 RepID=A0AAW2WCQ6_9LAMI
MRYKSEAFGRFKEYRLEVENQTNRKIKTLRSDRGCEYLSGEFIDYLKENGILSKWTPPGTPQLNGVAERRNRTLLDMVRSMMSFTELPPSFWGYTLETQSTRESRVSERYGFVGLTSQLDNDPKTYGEAMSDIDSDKWLEAMKFKMDSMGSNRVWTLVDPPKGVRPVGCKWVYKRKLGADGEWPLAKSIRILLAIAAWYDYEIWQMDVKTAFLNGFVEEEIFMDQRRVSLLLEKNRKSVVSKGPSTASSKLPEAETRVLIKSYGVMISSRMTVILVYTKRSVGARLVPCVLCR